MVQMRIVGTFLWQDNSGALGGEDANGDGDCAGAFF